MSFVAAFFECGCFSETIFGDAAAHPKLGLWAAWIILTPLLWLEFYLAEATNSKFLRPASARARAFNGEEFNHVAAGNFLPRCLIHLCVSFIQTAYKKVRRHTRLYLILPKYCNYTTFSYFTKSVKTVKKCAWDRNVFYSELWQFVIHVSWAGKFICYGFCIKIYGHLKGILINGSKSVVKLSTKADQWIFVIIS